MKIEHNPAIVRDEGAQAHIEKSCFSRWPPSSFSTHTRTTQLRVFHFWKILREINKCLLDTSANISSNNMTVHEDRRNLRKILWKSSKMRALVPTLVSLQVMLMHPKRRIQVILAFLVVLGLFSYVVITPSSNNSVKNLEPKREAFKGNFFY